MLRTVLTLQLLLSAALPALAGEKPLLELGVAGGGAYLPDYPAAGQSHFNAIALPYVVYRGEFLRAEGSAVSGRIVRTRNVELDISLSGSFSVDSDDNDDRRGMEDLDYLVELGPRLQLTLARAAKWAKVDLELPLRAVFSTDLGSIDYEGVVAQPALAYQHGNVLETGTQLKLSLSATVADEGLQDYFYEVETRFATPARPAFDADAGYLGSALSLLLRKPLGERFTLFGLAQASYHAGAANESSPLHKEDLTYSVGVGLIFTFYRSDRTVPDDD